jgi:hypothetical protein
MINIIRGYAQIRYNGCYLQMIKYLVSNVIDRGTTSTGDDEIK